jgi:16S rRNA (guanine527-N7)-methyltransferase
VTTELADRVEALLVEHRPALEAYVHALLEANNTHNLTAERTRERLIEVHVRDSLHLAAMLDEQGGELIDVGTGGGLPGIVLGIVRPKWRVTLLDSTQKKVRAAETLAGTVGVSVCAIWGRAEAAAHEATLREKFDAVTARAVAPLPTLVEYVAGFAKVGGSCWLFKTVQSITIELPAAQSAISECGLKHAGSVEYTLAGENAARCLLQFRKVRRLGASLPRRTGAARTDPL